MKLTSLILEQLDRESDLTRRALENVPDGKGDWKPHAKSMALGQLASLVASMPEWLVMVIKQDELDVKPKDGQGQMSSTPAAAAELVKALDKATADARAALSGVSDDFLHTRWRLLEAGKVVSERQRYQVIFETLHHLAHHRGQLTVYLRLNDAKVPALYGPSADEHKF